MVTIKTFIDYINTLLEPDKVTDDYCPNGLQIAGRENVSKIVTGVTANQALINEAIQLNADALLVHHGYFWTKEDPRLTGIKYKRIAALMQNQINLAAYHLCLDKHPVYGNNAQLARLFDFDVTGQDEYLWIGALKKPLSGDAFESFIQKKLNRMPFYVRGKPSKISKVAWCSGGAQRLIFDAAKHEADAYITGEVSLDTVDAARETGIHFYAAGHHATERYGIKALGEHLAEKFGLNHQFVDIDNPV